MSDWWVGQCKHEEPHTTSPTVTSFADRDMMTEYHWDELLMVKLPMLYGNLGSMPQIIDTLTKLIESHILSDSRSKKLGMKSS